MGGPFPALAGDCNAGVRLGLASGSGGDVLLTWEWGSYDCNVPYRLHARFRPASGPWGAKAKIAYGGRGGYFRSTGAVDADGNAIVAFQRNAAGAVVVRRRAAHRGWAPGQRLGRGDHPVIAMNDRGAAVVGWRTERGDVRAARRTAAGGGWSPARRVLSLDRVVEVGLALDEQGTASLVAQRVRRIQGTWHTDLISTRWRAGGSWKRHRIVSTTPDYSEQVAVAVDSVGNLIAAWPGDEVWSALRGSAGSWEAAVRVSRSRAYEVSAAMAEGTGLVAWLTDTGSVQVRRFTLLE